MAGALLGFLRFNFPPASIFLGDSGSMLIGLVVGILGIQCSLKGPATIALTAPLALMTIPILDTLLAITRRKLTGRSIYATDRGHLHHCLLRSGLSHRRALILVAVLCLVTMVGTLTSLLIRNELLAILSALAVVCMLIVSRLFGYAEMLLVTNRLRATAVSFLRLPPKGDAHETEVHIQGTAGWSDLWRDLTICVSPLNIMKMRLDVNVPAMHEGYHASWHRPDYDGDDPNLWHAEIPLSASGVSVGRLELTGRRDDEPVAVRLATVAKLVENLEMAMGVLTVESPLNPSRAAETSLNGFDLSKRPEAALHHANGKA
jgi:UDP-GlcNAc:undecaprenyl-phosphate GlcNAc-1-phosphate transferase